MILKNGKRIDGMGDSMPIGSIIEYNGTDIPDGWEILPGDANVYIGAEEPTEGQEVWISPTSNLYNPDTDIELISQFRDHNNGGIANSSFYNGIKIAVEPLSYYTTASNVDYGSWSNLCFFDANMNYLSGLPYNTEDKSFYTPSNCAYITIALLKSSQWFVCERLFTNLQSRDEAGNYNKLTDSISAGLNPNGAKIWLRTSDNILNLQGLYQNSGANGITIKFRNNTIEVSGTSTAYTQSGYLSFNRTMDSHCTLTSSPMGERSGVFIKVQVLRGDTRYYWDANGGSCRLEKGDILEQIYFIIESGKTVNAHYQLKLERGWNYSPQYEEYTNNAIFVKNANGKYEEFCRNDSVYDTREQRVGTWIDGKPLYQRTYVFTLGDGVRSANIDLNIDNLDTVFIDSGASLVEYGSLSTVQLGFYAADTDFTRGFISGDKTYIGIAMGTAYTSGEKVVTTTIKYTKTTD